MDDIGRMLRAAREERNLSKAAASRQVGVTRMTYDMWERGAWVPDMDNIDALAEFTAQPRDKVITILARANGYIDEDAYIEVRYGKRPFVD